MPSIVKVSASIAKLIVKVNQSGQENIRLHHKSKGSTVWKPLLMFFSFLLNPSNAFVKKKDVPI